MTKKKQYRRYSPEFKKATLKRAAEEVVTDVQVCQELGIHAQKILHARERLNAILSKHTGRSVKQIEADTERDRFMSGEEALTYGLIDEVLEQRVASPSP